MIKNIIIFQLITLFFCIDTALAAKQVITPTIEIKQEYTDNVLFSSQNATDDLITTLSPGIYLSHETVRHKASFDGRLDALRYADNSDLDTVDQFYQGKLSYLFSPQLSSQMGLRYHKDSRSDRDIDSTGIILSNSTRENKNFDSSLKYTLSEKSSGSVGYYFEKSDTEDPTLSNLTSHNVSASYTLDLSKYWRNSMGITNFGFGHNDYETSTIDSYSLTLGVQKKITELYTVDFQIGPRYTVSDFQNSLSSAKNWGIKLDLSLAYEGEKTKTSLSFSNDLNSGTTNYVGTSNKTSLTGRISRRFSDDLSVNLQLSYHLNKTDSGELSLSRIDETSINVAPGISYKINQNFSLKGSYTFGEVKNDVLGTRSERNLFFIKINYRWPLKD